MSGRTTVRHLPQRRCVLCRSGLPQAELIRLVRTPDVVRLDLARELGGRGTWVCHVCAADPNEKRLRQVFRNQAPQVRALLGEALQRRPLPARRAAAASGTEA